MSKLSDWAKAVIERHPACGDCGSVDSLRARHITPRIERPDLYLDVANGTVLCRRCHDKARSTSRRTKLEGRPHRKTLLRRIAELDKEVAFLRQRAKKG